MEVGFQQSPKTPGSHCKQTGCSRKRKHPKTHNWAGIQLGDRLPTARRLARAAVSPWSQSGTPRDMRAWMVGARGNRAGTNARPAIISVTASHGEPFGCAALRCASTANRAVGGLLSWFAGELLGRATLLEHVPKQLVSDPHSKVQPLRCLPSVPCEQWAGHG